MKKLSIPLTLFLLLFLLSPFALAVPHYINYQGVLTDNNGDLVNADLEMTFSIYDASEEGNLLWSETHDDGSGLVEVRNGLFNVYLGSVNDNLLFDITGSFFIFDGSTRWLQVTIGNEDMNQRIPLVSVPYAYRAENLGGFTPQNFVWLGVSTDEVQVTNAQAGLFVRSTNSTGAGVRGESNDNIGVQGGSTNGVAVYGGSTNGDGVKGQSTSGKGVYAISGTGPGLRAESEGGNGIFCVGGQGYGIHAKSVTKAAVYVEDILQLKTRSSAPTPGSAGMVYYDSTTNKLRVHNGSGWVDLH